MALIPITGIPSSYKIPGHFVEITYQQGPASAATDAREVMIAMAKLSTGTGVAGTLYRVKSASQVATLAGEGSFAHRAAIQIFTINKFATVHYLCVALTTGTAAAADLDVTFSGTITARGLATTYVCGEACHYSHDDGTNDTFTTVAAGIAAAINAKRHLPVTASPSSGVVTLTAKADGTSSGDGTTGAIRVHSEVTPGTGLAVADEAAALGLGTATDGAEGTTTQAAQLTTALNNVVNSNKYYVVTELWSATGLTAAQTWADTKALPLVGRPSKIIAGYTGTLANGATLATGRNSEHIQIGFCPSAEEDPASIAGMLAGVRSLEENRDPSVNMAGYALVTMKAPYLQSDWLDGSDTNDAILDGLTPLRPNSAGQMTIVLSVNTRSKDLSGSTDDFRCCETHRPSTAEKAAEELVAFMTRTYQRAKLKSDEYLADGVTVNPAQKIPKGVVTPSTLKGPIRNLMGSWNDKAWIQELQATRDSLQAVRDPDNNSRVEFGFDLHVIDHFNQGTYAISEVSTG